MTEFNTGIFEWDIRDISSALRITLNDARLYFTDGRKVSFLMERRIAYEVLNGRLAPSEGAGYDVIDDKGYKWEVRSISKGGIYFCPSYMVGSGRSFNESGFLQKIEEIEGFIVTDIEKFPAIPYWIIPAYEVVRWWEEGSLGTTTKITRKKMLELLHSG